MDSNKVEKSMYASASAPPMPAPPPYSSVVEAPNSSSFYPPEQPAQLYSSPSTPVVVIYQQPGQTFDSTSQPLHLVKSPDYIIWSIFNTFCCCCLLGLFATLYSFKTKLSNKNPLTNFRAVDYSRTAYRLNVCATVLGVISLLFGAIYEIIDIID